MARFSRKGRFSRNPRFRRKRRVTWFPSLGTYWEGDTQTWHDASINIATNPVGADKSLGTNLFIRPVTKDFTVFPPNGGIEDTLRDIVEGQTWGLERIVGRVTCQVNTYPNDPEPDPTVEWPYVQVGCGLFIAKVDDSDQSLPTGVGTDYDPLEAGNIQNPWIWRKTWILGNPGVFEWDGGVPSANTLIMPDGGYVDSKVKRYIAREHRLFFALSAIGWYGEQLEVSGGDQPTIVCNADLRILGGMRRARNMSSF